MPGFRIPFWSKPSSDRRTPRYLWRSLAACAIGLVLSLAAALATGQRELQLAQIELNGLANGYALTLQFGISTYMRKVTALRTLFDTFGTVSREQFASFSKQLLTEQVAIVGMAWLPRVPREQREEHERAGAQEGLLGYHSDPPGRTAPERPLRIETSISRSSMPQPRLLILRSMARISMMAACGNGRLRALATMIGWRPVRILCWKESASAFWWQLRYTVGVYRMGRCRSAGSI